VAQVETAVHVRIRKSDEEFLVVAFLRLFRSISLVDFLRLPFCLDLSLDFLKVLDFEGSFSVSAGGSLRRI